jgi:RHS repeat-associated protein
VTNFLFAGQEIQPGDHISGLYWMGSRFYDALSFRFLSPDTMVPDPRNPQALNRYSYVNNNPMRYTDPTGHMEVIPGSEDANAAFGAFDVTGYGFNSTPSEFESPAGSSSTGIGSGGDTASVEVSPAVEQQAYAAQIVTDPSAFVDYSGVSTEAQVAEIANANGWQQSALETRPVNSGPYAGETYQQTIYSSPDGLQQVRVHTGMPGYADTESTQMRWTYAVPSGTAGAAPANPYSHGLSFRSLDINGDPAPFNSNAAHIPLLAAIERFADILSGRWR